MTLENYRIQIREEKSKAALDAAMVLFLAQGYDRTSLVQVARDASISTGTLFKHFPTKAALFGAVIQRLWNADTEMAKPLPKAGSPKKGLTSLGLEYAEVLGHKDTLPIFRVIMAEAPRFPELGEYLFECGKMPFLHRIHLYLNAEIALGTLAVNDMPLAASQFLGMINDAIFWPRFFLMSMTVTPDRVKQVINEAVTTMLHRYGVAAKPLKRIVA